MYHPFIWKKILENAKKLSFEDWGYDKTKSNHKKRLRVTRPHMFNTIAKANGHLMSTSTFLPSKTSQDIFLYTNAFDLKLDINYTFFIFHLNNQTIVILRILILRGSYVYKCCCCCFFFFFFPSSYWSLKWRNYPPPYFTYNHVGDIFPRVDITKL